MHNEPISLTDKVITILNKPYYHISRIFPVSTYLNMSIRIIYD